MFHRYIGTHKIILDDHDTIKSVYCYVFFSICIRLLCYYITIKNRDVLKMKTAITATIRTSMESRGGEYLLFFLKIFYRSTSRQILVKITNNNAHLHFRPRTFCLHFSLLLYFSNNSSNGYIIRHVAMDRMWNIY